MNLEMIFFAYMCKGGRVVERWQSSAAGGTERGGRKVHQGPHAPEPETGDLRREREGTDLS